MPRRYLLIVGAIGCSLGATLGANETEGNGPLPFEALPADAVSPFGGMAISPTRVIIQPGEAGGQVTLYNSGATPVSYRIDAVDLVLDEVGGYREVEDDEAAPWSALPLVRYAPRQVTLRPGERQAIKIVSIAARDLPPQEYRSHLRFSSIPTIAPVEPSDDSAEASGDGENRTVTVSVGLDYRITIPLLLRTAEAQAGAAIASAQEIRGPQGERLLSVELARTAAYSDYGSLRVFDAADQEIGVLRGVAVLPPLNLRNVAVPLTGSTAAKRVTFEVETADKVRIAAQLTIN